MARARGNYAGAKHPDMAEISRYSPANFPVASPWRNLFKRSCNHADIWVL